MKPLRLVELIQIPDSVINYNLNFRACSIVDGEFEVQVEGEVDKVNVNVE